MPERRDAIEFLTGRLKGSRYPTGISLPGCGGKFATDGTVQYWPGNTFICHLDPETDAWRAVRDLQEEVKCSSYARLYSFLPPPSFHMTIMPGISPGNHLAQEGKDPSDAEVDRKALSNKMLDQVSGLDIPRSFQITATDLFALKSLTVTGLNSVQERSLRQARTLLRNSTGLESDDFDDYVFHITLAYLVCWLSDSLAEEVCEHSAGLFERYRHRLAEIELGPVEFCEFNSMHHFEPLIRLE